MAILKKPEESSYHFYSKDGKAVHRVPVNGNDSGDTRATTIADARKLGLYPSVTTILQILDRPGLNRWKHEQIAAKGISIKRKPKESDEDLIARTIEEAFQQVRDAADLGSQIHHEIERFFIHDWSVPFQPDAKVQAYVGPVVRWLQQKNIHVENPEKVLINHLHGFAGTTDCPFKWKQGAGIGVLDYKSKKTKPGEPVRGYPEQSMQIAAYAATYWGEQNLARCWGANVYISTTEPGRVDLIMYKPAMLVAEFEIFKQVCALYRHFKQWDPRVGPNDPQPVFHSGVASQISLPGGVPVDLPPPAPGLTSPPPPPPPPPPSQTVTASSPVVQFPETGRTMLDLIMGAKTFVSTADGIDFLDPKVCAASFQDGSVKTNYAWYFNRETGEAKIGLIGDAALSAHGWQNCFKAYPKHLDHFDRAAGKKDPVVGTNNLPVKPAPASKIPPGPKITEEDLKTATKEEKKPSKVSDAARLVQLEVMTVGFGRHKDVPLGKVDDSYLDWLRGQPQILKSHAHIAEYLGRDDINKAIDRALKRKGNK